jgi:hypothetical protein
VPREISTPFENKIVFLTKSTMVNRCVVCFSLGNRGFFSFPKDPVRRQLWLDHCGLSRDYQLKISHCVCYHHFKPEDMKSNTKKISLLKSAIPSKMVITRVELPPKIQTIEATDCTSVAQPLTPTPTSCPRQVVVIGPRKIPFHVNHMGVIYNFIIEDNKTIDDLTYEVKKLTGCSQPINLAIGDYPGSSLLHVLELPSDNRLYLSCQPGQCHSVPATSSPIQQPSFEVCNFNR